MTVKLSYRIFKPIEVLNKIIPKRKNRILLYSNVGFRDNVKSLFDYLIKNNYNEKYQIICSINDYRMYINQKIKNVKFVGNKLGIIEFLRSKYMFYCFGKYPIVPSDKQMVINMWHGMPLKRIGRMEKNNKDKKYDYFSFVLSTSDFFRPYMAEAFGCEEQRVIICGQPRTDELFVETKGLDLPKSKYMFLWMPTYRQVEGSSEENGDIDNNGLPICCAYEKLFRLNTVLKENTAMCYIKLHPIQKKNLKIDCERLSNIIFIDDNTLRIWNVSLYQFISLADALITDYSSVYIDYLLLNRPICFTVDDFEEYARTRGFIVDNPLDIMPGKQIKDFGGLIGFINDTVNGKDEYCEIRQKTLRLFHRFSDNMNTKRLLDYCGIVKK